MLPHASRSLFLCLLAGTLVTALALWLGELKINGNWEDQPGVLVVTYEVLYFALPVAPLAALGAALRLRRWRLGLLAALMTVLALLYSATGLFAIALSFGDWGSL